MNLWEIKKIIWNVDKSLCGNPSDKFHSTDELTFNIVNDKLQFENLNDEKSKYIATLGSDKATIEVSIKINHISRSSLLDNTGRPKYLVSESASIQMKPIE